MSRIRLIALVAMMVTGAAHLANAETPYESLVLRFANTAQANTPAQVQAGAQNKRRELSLMLTQDRAAKNPWSVTNSGVNIQSRAGFVGYH